MPYFTSGEEWQRQSALLLQARPNTTRITTKYHIPHPSTITPKPSAPTTTTTTDQPSSAPPSTEAKQPIIAYLELKTFDPLSGVTLKYKTDKAAEVGRLVAAMGTLAREMAALPQVKQDVTMTDAITEGVETIVDAVASVVAPAATPVQNTAGKKKKKGKK
ncbi:hypothetical protein E4T39_07475 [Aureobasidium subglaciale]|nr:hypothetical protein E4T39_07475 [Aureobasidium subglaciale]